MIVFYSPKFLRSFSKLARNIQDEFRQKEVTFRKNIFEPSLRTHKLKARNEWAFLVTHQIRDKLGSKIIIQHKMNHFSGNWDITELPVVLEELLKMVPISSKLE